MNISGDVRSLSPECPELYPDNQYLNFTSAASEEQNGNRGGDHTGKSPEVPRCERVGSNPFIQRVLPQLSRVPIRTDDPGDL